MIRKLVLAWVMVGALIWLCVDVRPAAAGQSGPVQFQVLVQDGTAWRAYGTYTFQSDARQAAMRLWKEGKRVLIQEVVVSSPK